MRRAGLVLLLLAPLALGAADAAPASGFSYSVPLDRASPWPKFRRDAAQTRPLPDPPAADGRRAVGLPHRPGDLQLAGDRRRRHGLRRLGRPRLLRDPPRRPAAVAAAHRARSSTRRRCSTTAGACTSAAATATCTRATPPPGAPVWTYAAEPRVGHRRVHQLVRGQRRDRARRHAGRAQRQLPHLRLDRDDRRAPLRLHHARPDLGAARGRCRPRRTRRGGNNYFLGGAPNVFGLGRRRRPALAGRGQRQRGRKPAADRATALAVAGGFDGFVHAYDAAGGRERWSFATRDHIYSSAARAARRHRRRALRRRHDLRAGPGHRARCAGASTRSTRSARRPPSTPRATSTWAGRRTADRARPARAAALGDAADRRRARDAERLARARPRRDRDRRLRGHGVRRPLRLVPAPGRAARPALPAGPRARSACTATGARCCGRARSGSASEPARARSTPTSRSRLARRAAPTGATALALIDPAALRVRASPRARCARPCPATGTSSSSRPAPPSGPAAVASR